jgi:ABC-type glycerol-3-phosphate transport system substrate-binding protein
LLTAAKRLTKTDGQQVIRQGYDLSRWTGTASHFARIQDFAVYLWQIGGELFDDEYQPLFTSPESIATMEFLFQLKEAVKPPGYQVVVPSGGGSALIKGAAVINLAGGWISSQVHQYAPDLLDVVKAIVPVPGEKNQVTNTFTNWLGIHSQSRNKELAWEFIKAVTQPTVLVDLNAELGLLSPRRSTITEFARRRPLSKYMYETVEYVRSYPVFPMSSQLTQAWSSQYTLAIEGQLGIVPAMEEASRQWRVILQEWSGAKQ